MFTTIILLGVIALTSVNAAKELPVLTQDLKNITNFQNDCAKGTDEAIAKVTKYCFKNTEGSGVWCVREGAPWNGFTTAFLCSREGGTYKECDSCVILEADSMLDADRDDRTCNDCQICRNHGVGGRDQIYSFDCSNIYPGESWSVINCDGEIIGNGIVPQRCTSRGDGTETCTLRDEDSGTITVFTCPDKSENWCDCTSCQLVQEDDIYQIDFSDPSCNRCSLCQCANEDRFFFL